MRASIIVLFLCAACATGVRAPTTEQQGAVPQQASAPPAWAYGFAAPAAAMSNIPAAGAAPAGGRGGGGAPPAPDTAKRMVAGSTLAFTPAQIRDTYAPADWFPGDHGTMPTIVARGKRDAQVLACSLCHYPNGKGRPENAAVSGLSVEYFVQTMHDFRNDARTSADTRKTNTARMIGFAKSMTEEEIRATAEYFGAIKWTPWVRVVETEVAPRTRIAGGLFIALEGAEAGQEPIGERIIEVPEDAEQTEALRNPRSPFIAYVPRGSLSRGQEIAARHQCALCHGARLQGLGPVPGIAGRSPSYMVRQLFDMQRGVRKGVWGVLMKDVVATMTADEMRSVAAYAASRAP